MKKHRVFNIVLSAACAGLMVSAAVSFAQTRVPSKNVVGYVSLALERGTLIMLRNDFLQNTDMSTPETLFGSSLPVGSEVLVWDTTLNPPGYMIAEYMRSLGPPPTFIATTNWSIALPLNRGRGFWLRLPENAPKEVYEVIIAGSVPVEEEHSTRIAENLNMAAYAFPADVLWTNTSIAKSAKVGDEVYLWNKNELDGKWSYLISTYERSLGPPPTFTPSTNWTVRNMTIPVGRAVWYRSAEEKTWREERPYPEF